MQYLSYTCSSFATICSILRTSPISFAGSEKRREGTESEKDSAVLGVIFLVNRVWPRTVCRWHLRDNQSVPSCGAAGDFRHIFPLFGGQYRFVEMDETAGAVLLPSEKFHYRIRDAYRMKQNAAGLATICILSTAVIVSVSTSFSLYLGEEDILKLQFPRDYHASCILEKGEEETAIFRRELSIRQRRTASP